MLKFDDRIKTDHEATLRGRFANELVAIITRPVHGVWWCRYICQDGTERKKRFPTKWQAASWAHALYDNEMGVSIPDPS